MRCSGVLELIVRKGAGMELFPGESSGYNSSASSVAGDPPRLSALQEETPINGNINGLPTNGSSEHHHHNRTVNSTSNRPEYPNGCTVIHVGGADDVDATNEANHLNNNNNNKKQQIAEICMVSQQLETKTTTVFVEVHHSEDDNVSHAQQRPPFVDPRERDKDKKPSEKLIKSGLAKEKVQQHEQLMEEFKKAHRKMFAGEQHNGSEHNVKEEREESRLSSSVAKTNDTVDSPRMDVKSEPKTKRQTAPPPPPPFPRALEAPGEEQFRVPPPPKPPSSKKYPAPTPPSQPPPPPSPPHCPTPDYDTASLASEALDNNRYNNYQAVNNNKTAVRNGLRRNDGRTDKVEMQSLESFKLTNPSKVKPRPPPTYFTPTSSTHSEISNGSTASTLPAKDRPVVTIREYPDGRDRKNPTKFDFLQNGQAAGQFDDTEPIACRLQNELSQTLSRAAVLNRDESQCTSNGAPKGTIVTINVNHSQLAQKSEQAKPFYLFHGQNGVQNGTNGSQAQKISTMIHSAAQKTKSKTAPMEKNSVTFNFNQKAHEIRNGVNSAPQRNFEKYQRLPRPNSVAN
ncbi:unnamed protein product [Nesidiocoris tenuis]|uniref:Uncharacterized protein n=1 Tax=Nesidiocoris tenuis TaxID=355587 RepID=A0A6H5G4V0_9HEMI|nr:unnamed protein product [Nesidiocoris tenuis]